MKLWKWLGLAGIAGVAATGAVVVRDQRRRAQLTPDEVRQRLHSRLAEAGQTIQQPGGQVGQATDG